MLLKSLLVVGLLAPLCAFEPAKLDLAALQSRFPGAPVVYEAYEVSLEMDSPGFFKPVSRFTVNRREIYVLLKGDESPNFSFTLTLDKRDEVKRAQVKWTLPDGATKEVDQAQFKTKELAKEKRELRYELPALPAGTRVEYLLSMEEDGTLTKYKTSTLPKDAPVLHARLSLLYPSGWTMKVKNPQAGSTLGTLSRTPHQDGKRTLAVLDLKDIFPKQVECLEPRNDTPTAFNWQIAAPPSKLYTPEEMVGNMFNDSANKDALISNLVETTTDRLTKDIPKVRDKVQAIYNFLQKDMKQNPSFHGNFASMLESMQGTSGSTCGLMAKMVGRLGVGSKLILIHSSSNGPFDPDYISGREAYQPALLLDLEGVQTFALPYDPWKPLGETYASTLNQPAILLKHTDRVEILQTPSSQALESTSEEGWKVDLDEHGGAEIRIDKTLAGPIANEARRTWSFLSEAQQKDKRAVALLMNTRLEGSITSASTEGLDDEKKPLVLHMTIKVAKVSSFKGGAVALDPAALPLNVRDQFAAPVKAATRTKPIWLPHDRRIQRTLTLNVPKEWKLGSELPEGTKVDNSLGSAESTVTRQGASILFTQSLRLKNGLHPVDKQAELLALTGFQSPASLPSLRFQ